MLPILQEVGVPFEIAFCPERTIEGNALAELRRLPQIVGADKVETAMRATRLFMETTPTVVRVRSIEAAEMVKLIDNTSRDLIFAFSNEIAQACDAVGVSAIEVINAGKLGYPRTNLPLPGPVGGPCLTKDPYILAQSVEGTALYQLFRSQHGGRMNNSQPGLSTSLTRCSTSQLSSEKRSVSRSSAWPSKASL